MLVRTSRRLFFPATIAFAGAFPGAPVLAQEGLLVAPTRIVFEGRQRTAEVTLLNTGETLSTYRISFMQLRMREDGSFEEIATPEAEEQFSDQLVRYSPRQVFLEPHVPQTIRLQLRKPPDLAPGEYRSHLLFRAIPSSMAEGGTPGSGASAGIDIRLLPIYGISIPIIVRHGETSASVTLEDLELRPDTAGAMTFHFAIHRGGTRSLFGDVTVTLDSADGPGVIVAAMKGVAVYMPNIVRRLEVPLDLPMTPLASGRRLRVSYTSPESGLPLATAELHLP